MLKNVLQIAILIFSIAGCSREKGFTVKKITPQTALFSKWGNEGDEELVLRALEGEFRYLGSGSHMYVFASDTHVIKFFKQNRLKNQKERACTSCHLAFAIPDITALVYTHLASSIHLPNVPFVDQHGKKFTLNMNEFEFIIQKRAEVGFAYIENLLRAGKREEAHAACHKIKRLITRRAQAGIGDRDLQIHKNFGFIGKEPVELDIGNLTYSKEAMHKLPAQLKNIQGQLDRWLQDHEDTNV